MKAGAHVPQSSCILVVAVPPVDELDLIGPLQVFSSVNRLAGRTIYHLEIATSGKTLQVEGEGGVLTFLARKRLAEVKGEFDSVLLVCGLASRLVRDRALSAWLRNAAASTGGNWRNATRE